MEKVDHGVELPNKLYFRIGEVAKILGVKPYVLRYWETEFSVLKPGKTPSRHRLYRRRDVETLLEIKRLLYEEGFTIVGAKKKLKEKFSPKSESIIASQKTTMEESTKTSKIASTDSEKIEHLDRKSVV